MDANYGKLLTLAKRINKSNLLFFNNIRNRIFKCTQIEEWYILGSY